MKFWRKLNSNLKNKKSTIFIFFIVTIFISLFSGRYSVKVDEILTLFQELPNFLLGNEITSNQSLVFYYIRLPRIILALVTGVVLGGTGVVFQGVFKNPLASPDVLGVTAGCTVGAAIAILLPFEGNLIIQVTAFVFGIVTVFITYGLAKASKNKNIVMLVLAGMVVSAFFSAMLSLIKYMADPFEQLPAIVFWTMGGFHRASWPRIQTLLITVLPCIIFLKSTSWKLNILCLGDEDAQGLGINVKRLRLIILSISAFMVASCISITGTVGWVALVVPHITRLYVGADHSRLLPMSMLVGGGFTVLMDTIARSLTTSEIPISILTAAIGAPVFAYLLIVKSTVEG
ncbi:iron ABC transporter permease [Alkalicella caledoniensis]|uniref:Iron ABC transporter permease n=2 Tax=Alkalicella caledoniensis TaxID=2731377 RepID=A0A7G9WDF3_ALKCA|nr:iron ABC transporter permease [Alkalicella caledoniensis]